MSTAPVHVYIDGAARGNPGPAAFAYVMTRGNHLVAEEAGCLGQQTNNVAEYTALLRALARAAELGERQLLIHSDSELLVKQMNGVYRVKNKDLQVLHEKAKDLLDRFDSVTIQHVPREQNSRADRLCNEALDGPSGGGRGRAGPSKPPAADRAGPAREQALECLRSAATAWARGRPNDPPVDAVWEQLWSILQDHGLLRPSRS
jgi:ribonuclease HI